MNTNHPKWQKTLRKILDCIKVYRFNMDEYGVVLVSGRTNPYVLLNKIGKAGNRAELVLLQSGECSGCLNMPPSSATAPPLPPLVTEDDRQYANDYDYPRRRNPCYNLYAGGGGGYGYGYGNGHGNGNSGGYGGWGGYSDCPRPSYGPPLGEWEDLLLDRFLNTSSGW